MILDIEVEFCFLTSTERISRCRKQEKVRPAPACSFVLPQKTSPKFYPGRIRSDVCGMPGTPSPSCLLEAPQKGWLKWNATTVLRDNLGWWSAKGGPISTRLRGSSSVCWLPFVALTRDVRYDLNLVSFGCLGSFFWGGSFYAKTPLCFFHKSLQTCPLKICLWAGLQQILTAALTGSESPIWSCLGPPFFSAFPQITPKSMAKWYTMMCIF